jgi:integrase
LSKTMEPLVLPLTKNVGEALQDYILNGRPKCDYEEIFIRLHAPHQPFIDGTGIQYLYSRYRRKAGLSRKAFDGKGFHSLRRSVGKRMVTSGVPVTTVAQVLGHTDINSTQRYISLDSVHLKECALDFHGIEVDNG